MQKDECDRINRIMGWYFGGLVSWMEEVYLAKMTE